MTHPQQLNLLARIASGPTGAAMADAIRRRSDAIRPCPELDAGLQELTAWIQRPGASCALVLAPLGAGKSTLLTQFAASMDAVSDVVLVSCESLGGINLAHAAVTGLVRQLSILLRKRLSVPNQAPLQRWIDTAHELLRSQTARTLLVILDGVDEYTDPSGLASLFPEAPASGVRVVLSLSSEQSAEASRVANQLGLGSIPLTIITPPYAGDAAVKAVFDHRLLGREGLSPVVWQLAGLLATAFGPLRRTELEAMTPWLNPADRAQALEVLEPLLSRTPEVQLADTRVRGFFLRLLSEEQRRAWDETFLRWSRASTSGDIPAYQSWYAAAHAERLGARPEDLVWIIDPKRAKARVRLEGTFDGYRANVERALTTFAEHNTRAVAWDTSVPFLDQEVRCLLLEAAATPASIALHTLAALVDEGLWSVEQALYVLWSRDRDDDSRATSLMHFSNYLSESTPNAVWERVVDFATQMDHYGSMTNALDNVAPRLTEAARRRALAVLMDEPDFLRTAQTLAKLAAGLPVDERVPLIRSWADKLRATPNVKANQRTTHLLSMAEAMPAEQAPALVVEALLAAREIGELDSYVEKRLQDAVDSTPLRDFLAERDNLDLIQNHHILRFVAPVLPSDGFIDAMDACHATLDDPKTLKAYVALLCNAEPMWRTRLFPTALGLVKKSTAETLRGILLCQLVAACASAEDPLFGECIATIKAAKYERAEHVKAMAAAPESVRRRIAAEIEVTTRDYSLIEQLIELGPPGSGLRFLEDPKKFEGYTQPLPNILRRVFRDLPKSDRARGLEIAHTLGMVHHVLPFLDGEDLDRELEHVRNNAIESKWSYGLLQLREFTPEHERPALVRRALELEQQQGGPSWEPIRRVLKVAARLDSPASEELLLAVRRVLPSASELAAQSKWNLGGLETALGVVDEDTARKLVAAEVERLRKLPPWDFASGACKLVETMPEALRSPLAWEAFQTFATTPDQQDQRRNWIGRLVPYIDLARGGEALSLILALKDVQSRGMTIWEIAPLVPADRLDKALAAVDRIDIDSWRWGAVTALAKHTAVTELPRLLPRAYKLATSAISDYDAPEASELAGVLAKRAPELAPALVDMGRSIQSTTYRRHWLHAVSEGLSGPSREVVLDEVLGLARREDWPVGLLPRLSTLMSASELDAAARKELDVLITGETQEMVKSRQLATLVPLLPKHLLPKAEEIARGIKDARWRAQSLADVASRVENREHRFQLFVDAFSSARDATHGIPQLEATARYVSDHLAKQEPEFVYRVLRPTIEGHRRRNLGHTCDCVVGTLPAFEALGGKDISRLVGHALIEVIEFRSQVV